LSKEKDADIAEHSNGPEAVWASAGHLGFTNAFAPRRDLARA
jgi:hypothetical protein